MKISVKVKTAAGSQLFGKSQEELPGASIKSIFAQMRIVKTDMRVLALTTIFILARARTIVYGARV